jgi:hypothetical protein
VFTGITTLGLAAGGGAGTIESQADNNRTPTLNSTSWSLNLFTLEIYTSSLAKARRSGAVPCIIPALLRIARLHDVPYFFVFVWFVGVIGICRSYN